MAIKLNKVIRDLNVGAETIRGFLEKKNIKVDPSVNARIDESVYEMLINEFGSPTYKQCNRSNYAKIKNDEPFPEDASTYKCSNQRRNLDNKKSVKSKENNRITSLLRSDDSSRIFIDTCSLMHPSASKVFNVLMPILKATGKKLIVPNSCIDELHKHMENSSSQATAKYAFDLLSENKDYIEIRGEVSDGSFADNVFHVVFNKFRIQHTLILISEDKNLCNELLNLNNNKSVKGKPIYAYNCKQLLYSNKNQTQYRNQVRKKDSEGEQVKITTISDDVIVPNPIPVQGNYVYTKNGEKIKLVEDFKAGGEGTVYKVDSTKDYVAKVYHKGKLDKRKESKIKILISKKCTIDRVCMPVEMLYNENHQFVGYMMSLVGGHSLEGTIFKGEKGFTRYFCNWSRNDLIDFCINLLDTINELHKQGIIIGDINGSNILIKTPQEFSLIDTDSFQVGGFPCPVGKEEFTAPEIQGKEYKCFLRTIGNENFSIATLLFKILMFGVHPYQQLGAEDIVKEIKNGDFSFPYKGNSNKKIPNGNWCYFWSHLHPKIKEMFYRTFKKGGRNYGEQKRPSVDEWQKVLILYKKNLSDGYLSNVDEESLKLFPKTYKKVYGREYKECKICARQCDSEYLRSGLDGLYCSDCIRGTSEAICRDCGERFQYSNYRTFILGKSVPELCHICWMLQIEEKRNRNSIFEHRECYVCGKKFAITNGQYMYHSQKGLELPKRCKTCIDAQRYKPQTSGSDTKSKKESSGFCFLTTAACEYFGKKDDCMELTTLRFFRDNWLLHQDGGEQDILHYYKIAPRLVERMKIAPDYAETCETIMNVFIQPCVSLIQEKRYEECRSKYVELIDFMLKRYN